MAASPSATDTNIIKAGAAFNIGASTTPTGYTGTLTQDITRLSAQAPSDVSQRSLLPLPSPPPVPGTVGTLNFSPALLANTLQNNNATYTEVGYLYLNAGALRDATFTNVDQINQVAGCFSTTPPATDNCDCLLSTNTTNAGVPDNVSDVLINGRYGCYIGNKTYFALGRFVPDHFDTAISTVSGVPMPCPNGLTCPCLGSLVCLPAATGFVYSTQNFATQVIARNLAGGATQNYAGNFARAVTLSAWNAAGGTGAGAQNPSGALTNNSIANTVFALGIATTTSNRPIYTLSSAQTAPTDIYIRADEPVGADGVSSLRATNPTTTSVEGGVKVLNGRLKISNAYGSELLPLTLTATAQYYTATGWVNSLTDSVTKLALTYAGTLSPTPTVTQNPASSIVSGGNLTISIAAPGAGKAGTVTATPAIDPVSPGNPGLTLIPGTATFGVYKSNSGFIYRRESY
jgi:MSHA biogenesis protein MshQ